MSRNRKRSWQRFGVAPCKDGPTARATGGSRPPERWVLNGRCTDARDEWSSLPNSGARVRGSGVFGNNSFSRWRPWDAKDSRPRFISLRQPEFAKFFGPEDRLLIRGPLAPRAEPPGSQFFIYPECRKTRASPPSPRTSHSPLAGPTSSTTRSTRRNWQPCRIKLIVDPEDEGCC
jgi:hypothetical protein